RIDLSRAEVLRVFDYVLAVIEARARKRELTEVAYRMRFAHRHNVIVRLALLEHRVHCRDVILCVAPVPASFEISDAYFFCESKLYFRHAARDLSRDEFEPTSRTFVVKKNPVRAIHSICFAIVACEVE